MDRIGQLSRRTSHMPFHMPLAAIGFALAFPVGMSGAARAESTGTVIEKMNDQADAGGHAARSKKETKEKEDASDDKNADDKKAAAKKKKDEDEFLIVPIPQSNPAIGTGLALIGSYIYNPNNAPQAWTTGVAGLYTSTKSWAGGLYHRMSLDDDRYRILAMAGYGSFNMKYYGTGSASGSNGVSVDMNQRGLVIISEALTRVSPNLYAGLRYQLLDITSRVDLPPIPGTSLVIPPLQLESTIGLLGPLAQYDTRDNQFNPHKGEFMVAQWLFARGTFGSDFDYSHFTIAANAYRELGKTTVLAVRASMCAVSDGAPFYDICMYGSSNDLRGYSSGQYRDRASWATQAEIRQHVYGPVGVVVFAGMGGIGPSLDRIGEGAFLPAAGAGLRYEISKEHNINLALDFAVGKDSHATYFSVAEAF